MQHVYNRAENLGHECANHAVALGFFDLVSNDNLSTQWARHSFDYASCFATCHNLGDVFEKLRNIRTEHVSTSPDEELALCPRCATICLACTTFFLFVSRSFARLKHLQLLH